MVELEADGDGGIGGRMATVESVVRWRRWNRWSDGDGGIGGGLITDVDDGISWGEFNCTRSAYFDVLNIKKDESTLSITDKVNGVSGMDHFQIEMNNMMTVSRVIKP